MSQTIQPLAITPDLKAAREMGSPPRSKRSLISPRLCAGVAAILGILIVSGWMLIMLRQQTWLAAEVRTSNLATLIAQDIDRNAEMFDLSLQAVLDGLGDPDVAALSPNLKRMVLFDRAATARDFGAIKVLDASGRIVLDSTTDRTGAETYAGAPFFKMHQQNTQGGLFLSAPFMENGNDPVIAFSRRVTLPDRSFDGVVFGTMRLAYLRTLVSNLDVGSTGSISVFRDDGTLMMRSPYDPRDLGRIIPRAAMAPNADRAEIKHKTVTSSIDGVDRLYAAAHLKHAPLTINVALGIDEFLSEWRWRAILFGGVVLLLCGSMTAMAILTAGNVRQRRMVEQRLNIANRQLQALAATDSLTGLANRRVYDEVLARELRRSSRTRSELSLLVIDADHFKTYNDRYGHEAGDQVLKAIADVLSKATNRATDLACRIGGEEFAVILPETAKPGAFHVASRIHAELRKAAIEHADNEPGYVTVSIGLAYVGPASEMDGSQVFRIGDKALYKAKNAGRNRTEDEDCPLSTRRAVASL